MIVFSSEFVATAALDALESLLADLFLSVLMAGSVFTELLRIVGDTFLCLELLGRADNTGLPIGVC